MSKLTLLLFTLAVASASVAHANPSIPLPQQTPTPAPSPTNLGAAIEQTASNVLKTCGNWPPRLARNNDERKKNASDVNRLPSAAREVINQLAVSLSLDPSIQPTTYDGSFLRLLDSVGTYDPGASDDRLLGIALKVDPTQLNLWGTNQNFIKHDCLSMLSLAAKANAGYSIPFVSLDAAVNATQNTSVNQVSTFIYGFLQSPFEKLYNSTESSQRTFAAMRGIIWRLNPNNTGNDEYVLTAQMLSIDKNSSSGDTTTLLGNIKAGVQVPIPSISASGNAGGQLTSNLQSKSTTYITYFWQITKRPLPSLTDLVSSVNRSMPKFDLDSPEVTSARNLQASKVITGWPLELCQANSWTLKAGNTNYRQVSLTMDKSSAASGLPECLIKAKFTLSGALPAVPVQANYADPQLVIEHSQNASTRISLNTSEALYPAGKPSVIVEEPVALWTIKVDSTGRKSDLEWTVEGRVEGNGRVLTAIDVNPTDITCGPSSAPLPMSRMRLDAVPLPNFRAKVTLSLLGAKQYNDDPAQRNKKTCSINGSLRVSTTAQGGGSPQTEIVTFQTKDVQYPNELPTTAPSAPTVTATAGNTQITLAWTASDTAVSYKIYRGTVAGGEAPQPIKEGITSTSYVDTGLTNGTAYFYQVTAVNAAGDSNKSVEVTATPKP